ncbi:MAG TPA: endonuclease domain-containing protein [Gammaproteobacteria bacterium]|nr:endonuclease domain-containing protein [Gammaproteobacteria bacterium]
MPQRAGTPRARHLRNRGSDAEQRLWQRLRNRQVCGAKFRRQHPIPPYIVDFVCLEKRLVIEADGGQHLEQQGHDEKRTAFLETQGYRVLRFWNDEILRQTEEVLEVIFRALNETPHPNPLPKGERE